MKVSCTAVLDVLAVQESDTVVPAHPAQVGLYSMGRSRVSPFWPVMTSDLCKSGNITPTRFWSA